jgi:DNA-binding IclR family transcriptional regulator
MRLASRNSRLREEARHVMFTRIEHALRELKSLFLEDATRLIRCQDAAGVIALDEASTSAILNTLEHARFLSRVADGLYQLTPAERLEGS